MARFIALPVGWGDSFFLERGDHSCLVDGGLSKTGFATSFALRTGRTSVDVMVCTHNDADHVNGLVDYLSAGMDARELWLPARWAEALEALAAAGSDLTMVLANDVAAMNAGLPESLERTLESELEAVGNHTDPEGAGETQEGDEFGPGGLSTDVEVLLERHARIGVPQWPPFWPVSRLFGPLPPEGVQLWLEAIAAGNNILSLASEAYRKGIRIRWFTHDPRNPGGGERWMVPVNCRSLQRIRRSPLTVLRLLALTTVNKESLAFWSPPDSAGPGVLFCADGDLGARTADHARLPSVGAHQPVITCPHHGSAANDAAYDLIERHLGANANLAVWVRSDGPSKARPTRRYLSVQGHRFCTLCNHAASRQQGVVLHATAAGWIPQSATSPCSCK